MHAAPTQRAAAVRGWWFGAGFLLAALYWLLPNLGPALLLVVAVLGALWASVGAAAWGLLRPPVSPGRALAALVVVPSCWVAVDWVRSWQGFGGPWAVYGTSQWQHPAILALAAVGGVWLVSFALVAANTGILIILVARPARVRLLGAAAALIAIAAGPVAFALTAGGARAARQVTMAVVQPGVVHNPALRVDASQRLSAGLAARHADLIVWGESSVAYDLDTDTALLRQLTRLSAADRAQLLVNQDSIIPGGGKSKVAVLIGPGGIDGRYVKTRLVPFGEYIPFRQQLGWLAKISKAAPQNMIPGTGAHVMRVTPAGGRPLTIGVLICFESAVPRHVPGRHRPRRAAGHLPDLRLHLAGRLGMGAGPARRAGRGARRGDRPPGHPGRPDRRLRRVRPARPAPGLGRFLLPRGAGRPARPAAGLRPDAL